ncbi:hypothetical protein BGZ98_003125 [Dissophora globulifera]|nr:hypothetical protein BGZ98_003125 [Dissophora globulifera]
MYRRRIKRHPPPVFGDTLEQMGFSIDSDGHLIDATGKRYEFDLKAKNRDYQEAHGRALGVAAMRIMLQRMENELGLIKAVVPIGIDDNDTTSPHAHILLSSDVKEAKRVLVLVPGTMEMLGSWSRRILSNHHVEQGSMYDVVRQAREEGYGVAILNPNSHWWVDNQPSVDIPTKKDYALIPHLGSPEQHVDYVLRNFVQNFTSKEISFIAHKYGAHALVQALHAQFESFKDRVSAIAVIESTHSIDAFPDPIFQKWWSLNAVGFIQSEVEEKGKIEYKQHAGCNCIKAGTQQFDFTIVDEMPTVLRFLRSRKGRDNTFEHYKDVLQPENPDDPTTALVAFHIPDEDDDVSANGVPANGEAFATGDGLWQ